MYYIYILCYIPSIGDTGIPCIVACPSNIIPTDNFKLNALPQFRVELTSQRLFAGP